jgi:hypothetical protein
LTPGHVHYVIRGHVVINPFFKITSQEWWNTLQENITVTYDIIKYMQRKCGTVTTFLGFSLSQPQWNRQVGRGQD